MNRRQFVKTSALTAAVATANSMWRGSPQAKTTQTETQGVARRDERGIRWDKAPCRFCGTGCHVMVGVQKGRVVAIAGDQQAEVNRGLLCTKGYHVGLALYGNDRLTRPLLRQGERMVPISWERALGIIADRVQLDPSGFAFYGSGQWTIPEGYAAQKFMKGGLSNNHIDPNARLCMASAVTGFVATYGVDEPAGCYDDLDHCDVLIQWGNNTAEMHPVLFSRVIDRRARGEKVTLIDIGTRRTRTTAQSDHYLEMKPQGDLAIANGIAHLLLARGTYDREFVERYCAFRAQGEVPKLIGEAISFEDYQKALEPYTPAYVEELSGVPAKQIELLADLFGQRDLRITSLWCMGMNQHTRGTAINCLVHGVHLLSGHFGKPGDAPTSLTGQPSACGTVREVGTLAHALPGGRVVANPAHRQQAEALWELPQGRINPKPGYHTVKMWERFSQASDQGGDIHTIWVQVTNPGQTLPNRKKLFGHRAHKDKFLIVSDVYPTATTVDADLILPSALWVEKNGVYGNSERRTQQWFKQVEPPGQARDDVWQILAVARTLYDRGFQGMRKKDGSFLFAIRDAQGREVPVWEWPRFYSVNVDEALFDEYRRFTPFKHKDIAPYAQYVPRRGMRWPVVEQPDGSWRETRFRFAEFDDLYVERGRGIQFYHSTSKNDRAQIWFYPYTPPPEVPDDEYPFWLCTGRVLEHWHTASMTMRIPPLRRAMPEAYVEIHPADAARLSIQDGETISLETRRGRLQLKAWLNGRGKVVQGSLFVPFFDESLLINDLTLEDFDPFSKQPDFKKCAARVRRISRAT